MWAQASDLTVQAVDTINFVGGGSLPGQSLPGIAMSIDMPGVTAQTLGQRLRLNPTVPVYARIDNDRVLVELRTILPEDDEALIASLHACTSDTGAG